MATVLRPTAKGLGLLGLAFLLYLASMQATTGLLYLVLGVLFGCFVMNALGAWRVLRQLEVVAPPTLTGTEGTRLEGAWHFVNEGREPAGLCEVRSSEGVLVRVGTVGAESVRPVASVGKAGRRGVYPFRRLKLRSSWPFGLMAAERRCDGEGEIVVFPKVYSCEAPAAAGFEPMLGGKFKGQHRSAAGDDFHGVRPMESRDPVRAIHWPSSSKGQGLMVKEFTEELAGRVVLLALPGPELTYDGEAAVDWLARAMASLALAALDAGHQVELADPVQGRVVSVPPFADSEVVLAFCARIERPAELPGMAMLEELVPRLPRKAAICYVATGVPAELEQWALTGPLARRKQHLYLPETAGGEDVSGVLPVSRYSGDAVLTGEWAR